MLMDMIGERKPHAATVALLRNVRHYIEMTRRLVERSQREAAEARVCIAQSREIIAESRKLEQRSRDLIAVAKPIGDIATGRGLSVSE
jgi:hypothetical protein